MASLSVPAIADEAFEEAVRKCASIQDESARLTCFDAVAIVKPVNGAAPAPPAALTEDAAIAPAPEAPAGLAVDEPSDEIEVATGAAAAAVVAAEEAAQDSSAPQPLTDDVAIERVSPSKKDNPEYFAQVVRCDKHQQSGQTYFFLDNEQVWKQANYRRLSLGKCDFEVRLKKDAFGYEMTIPSKDRTVRVSRIR
ncbi:MAG: hypothetical protein AAFX10_13415 [Pseudomonadota bacterium]